MENRNIDVMTLQEAAEVYNIKFNTLRAQFKHRIDDLIEGVDYKKSGGVWLIRPQVIKKIYEKKGK